MTVTTIARSKYERYDFIMAAYLNGGVLHGRRAAVEMAGHPDLLRGTIVVNERNEVFLSLDEGLVYQGESSVALLSNRFGALAPRALVSVALERECVGV